MKARRTALALLPLVLAACATTILPGEVGVRSNFGRIEPEPYGPGIISHSPVGVRFYRVSTQTRALELQHDVTSRRGSRLTVEAAVVYAADAEQAPTLTAEIGPSYERDLLDPVFRWATQRAYSEGRAATPEDLAMQIRDHMNERIAPRGLRVEQVILERSALRSDIVYRAFEARVAEEQRAQQMAFEVDRARQEAERQVIEARGRADSHRILQDGLSPEVLQNESIEVFRKLVQSPNTTLILNDGSTPVVID